ncbi:DUF6415 family natural product biosynthesis protein [Streptomyces sp. NPDC007070]|uniref:DUF6415 family natural product biosynthesis protein n=1 Tax=Streptomyces sp. NPDC007070 TaxID=3154312 RepID=UPI0033DEBAA5
MSGVGTEPDGAALASVTVRAAAAWFLDQRTLPRHGTVRAFEDGFRRTLGELIPRVEQLAAASPADDVPAKVARDALVEARRRLDEVEAAGLRGEVERVRRIAKSVLALCGHHDVLAGLRTHEASTERSTEEADASCRCPSGKPSRSGTDGGCVPEAVTGAVPTAPVGLWPAPPLLRQ